MDISLNESSFDGDLTGQIGTALYVAPEMNAGRTTATYNQKVSAVQYILYGHWVIQTLKKTFHTKSFTSGKGEMYIIIMIITDFFTGGHLQLGHHLLRNVSYSIEDRNGKGPGKHSRRNFLSKNY